jgi:hypothetical protein
MEGLQPEQLRILFRWFKEGPPGAVAIEKDGQSLGLLQAVGWEDAGTIALLEELSRWHGPDLPDSSAARRWLVDEVLPVGDRVLFWVKDVQGRAVGHVGLSCLDQGRPAVAIADVLCGDPAEIDLVSAGVAALVRWANHSLRLPVHLDPERLAA